MGGWSHFSQVFKLVFDLEKVLLATAQYIHYAMYSRIEY